MYLERKLAIKMVQTVKIWTLQVHVVPNLLGCYLLWNIFLGIKLSFNYVYIKYYFIFNIVTVIVDHLLYYNMITQGLCTWQWTNVTYQY